MIRGLFVSQTPILILIKLYSNKQVFKHKIFHALVLRHKLARDKMNVKFKKITISNITLKQVSKISGYSISTVSKALNNWHDISKETKVKVQKLAKRVNQIANNSANALRIRKIKIIVVIAPKINHNFYNNILSEKSKREFLIMAIE